MPKLIYQYDLDDPDDRRAAEQHQNAERIRQAVYEFEKLMRDGLKYEQPTARINLSSTVEDVERVFSECLKGAGAKSPYWGDG